MLVKRNIFFRLVALLLMLLILIMPVFIPAAQAVVIAGAAAYGAVELIAAMLIGGGVVYATSDDARSAAAQVYDWVATNASAALDKINFWVAQAIVSGVSTGIRVSQDVWDAIASAFESLFSDAPALDVFEYGRSYTFDSAEDFLIFGDLMSLENAQKHPVRSIYSVRRLNSSSSETYSLTYSLYEEQSGSNTKLLLLVEDDAVYSDLNDVAYIFYYPLYDYGLYASTVSYGDTSTGVGVWYKETADSAVKTVPLSTGSVIGFGFGSYIFSPDSVIPSNDLVFPSDNSLVRVPDLPDVQTDEDGKEVVVYPDLSLNPADHLADIPVSDAGEQVDVPYDTLVDVGTGEVVGEGEGTGEGDITDPADPAGTLPKPGDLSLPKLIISKFPFCIPFDVANLIGQLNASAEAPVIRIPVKTIDAIATQYITIDFSQYESLVSIVRWGIYILFVAGLAYATRNYIKW